MHELPKKKRDVLEGITPQPSQPWDAKEGETYLKELRHNHPMHGMSKEGDAPKRIMLQPSHMWDAKGKKTTCRNYA
jgi:hypothetical protein